METKELNEKIARKYAEIWRKYAEVASGMIFNTVILMVAIALSKDLRILLSTNETLVVITAIIVFGPPLVYFVISTRRPFQEIDKLRKTKLREKVPEKYWKFLKIDK